MVKQAWKKTETYIVIALLGAGIDLINKVLTTPASALGLPPQYAAIVAAVLAAACPALAAYFAKLRHDAYAAGGIPDPNPDDQAAKS